MTSYFLVISLSIILVGFIITIDFFNEMAESEELKQINMLDNLVEHSILVQNSVSDCIIGIYDTTDYGRNLSSLLEGNDEIINEVEHYLNGVTQLDNNIVDVMVFNNNNQLVFHKSSYTNRSVSKRYNFDDNSIIRELNNDPNISLNIYMDVPQYIIENAKPVISYAGNLFNIDNQISEKKSIGKYIINIGFDSFNDIVKENHTTGETHLYISKNNVVVYAPNNEEIGKEISSYIVKDKYNKLSLSTQIINDSYIFDNQFRIHIVTSTTEFVNKIKKYIGRIAKLLMLCLLVAFVITLNISRIFTSRIKILLANINQVRTCNLDIKIKPKSFDEIGQLEEAFSTMCFELNKYINQVYISQIKTKSAEQAALQMKINPHFLYNTIEILRMKALDQESIEIAEMLSIMGKIFRWNIKGSSKFVGIMEEIEFTTLYLNLLSYLKNIDYSINVDNAVKRCFVPKLIIQPIIENCINHGFDNKSEGKITISISKDSDDVVISVNDNGVGISEDKLKEIEKDINEGINQVYQNTEHVGIANVNHRIKLIYGNKYGVNINGKLNNGTSVKINIPYITYKEIRNYAETDIS
jgi:two-component system sensor histidine kinase YesM